MIRRNIKPGQCFRYFDFDMSYVLVNDLNLRIPTKGWQLTFPNGGDPNEEVELLEHFSTHPVPTPLCELVSEAA